MVVAGKGECNHSYWGDHRSICAKLQGVEGVVIDGAFRDIEGCRKAKVPIYAKSVIPQSCKKQAEGELNVPVECAGVEVHPGDLIVGDENGVCVIRPEEVESIIKKSERKIKAQNETIDEMLRTGKEKSFRKLFLRINNKKQMGLFQKGMSSLFYAILRNAMLHFIIRATKEKIYKITRTGYGE